MPREGIAIRRVPRRPSTRLSTVRPYSRICMLLTTTRRRPMRHTTTPKNWPQDSRNTSLNPISPGERGLWCTNWMKAFRYTASIGSDRLAKETVHKRARDGWLCKSPPPEFPTSMHGTGGILLPEGVPIIAQDKRSAVLGVHNRSPSSRRDDAKSAICNLDRRQFLSMARLLKPAL